MQINGSLFYWVFFHPHVFYLDIKDKTYNYLFSYNGIFAQNLKLFILAISLKPYCITLWYFKLNPIPAGGGEFFLHNSKSIGVRLFKFSDFSYIPKALPLDLKPGFNTNCLSPQAHCLYDCFFCNKLNLSFNPLSLVRFW